MPEIASELLAAYEALYRAAKSVGVFAGVVQAVEVWGGGGGTALDVVVDGESQGSNGSSGKAPDSPREVSQPKKTGATWLSDYLREYRAAYGFAATEVAIKRMARTLRDLEKVTPRAEVVRRFRNYVQGTKPRYYSIESFAAVFPFWADEHPTKALPGGVPNIEAGETVEAYTARLIRLGF